MGKLGPVDERFGTALYPGFYNTVPPGFGRLRRLEKGSQRLQRGQFRPVQGIYTRFPSVLLPGSNPHKQILDITSSSVKKVGGVPPNGSTAGFAYTATTSSITWYWDGSNSSHVPIITRADGSRFTVPTAGSGLTVSGLSANTTYYFLPFWGVNSQCNISWVPGTTGSPQIAFIKTDTLDPINGPTYIMSQTLQGNEALSSGFMSAVTPSTGTGGGGAGGGGGGGSYCVMAGTDIQTLGEIPYEIEVIGESSWVHLRIEDRRELFCTFDHPLYHAERGKIRADTLEVGDLIITDSGEQRIVTAEYKKRVCSKWRIKMSKGHLYYANGFLSHNTKAQYPALP